MHVPLGWSGVSNGCAWCDGANYIMNVSNNVLEYKGARAVMPPLVSIASCGVCSPPCCVGMCVVVELGEWWFRVADCTVCFS